MEALSVRFQYGSLSQDLIYDRLALITVFTLVQKRSQDSDELNLILPRQCTNLVLGLPGKDRFNIRIRY